MSTPHRGAPVVVSNNPDDFIQGGGLYPGGRGILKEINYAFWDYNGRQPPNSSVAVKCVFSPTDGSNEGKDETIYWSVGPATDYQPDETGGFCFAIGTKAQIADSSNWHFVADKFVKNCGMAPAVLNGPTGIKALERSEVTLVRMDQPDRNIDNVQQQVPVIPGQSQRKFKPTILVPTAAVFTWDRQGGTATGAAPTSTAAAVKARAAAKKNQAAEVPATAPAPAPAPVQAAPAAPAVTNGTAPTGNALISEVIMEILSEADGNAVELANLSSLLTNKLGPQGRQITAKARIDIIKQVKDPAFITALAASDGFNFDGEILSV
jgi:hypothetical protein